MKKTPLFTSRSLFIVIFTSYKVQTPHYFFYFWLFLARERLHGYGLVNGYPVRRPVRAEALWRRAVIGNVLQMYAQ